MAASVMNGRLARLEAIGDIRVLHATLGAALARGDASAATACFASDGEIEIANDGRFVGRERVLIAISHLLGLDDAQPSPSDEAPPARLHAAMPDTALFAQIMPIIEVDDDGRGAHAVWRILDTGAQRGEAYWAEGPALVRYALGEHGWRIRSLRWLRGLRVPFDGGWQEHATAAPAAPAPDAPTIDPTPLWPEVRQRPLALPRPHRAPETTGDAPGDDLDAGGVRVAALHAVSEVEALLLELAYDAERAEWTRCAEKFDTDVALSLGAVHLRGRAQALDALRLLCPEGELSGRLLDTIVFEPSVTVDGDRAHAGFRFLTQWALHERWHELGTGSCAAELRRGETGCWSIVSLTCSDARFTSYDEGWAREQVQRSRLFAPLDGWSDAPPKSPGSVTEVRTTGAPHAVAHDATERSATESGGPSLAELERDIDRLESRLEIEQTQMRYGYDLVDLDWDDLASLFTDDGTIEIALRGVYVGRDSVRRSLHLYGDGPARGVLHSHLQFQPLVRLSDDGTRADVRARAFSMMGVYQSMSMWSGGRYANEFVRDVDGRWRFAVDRIVNRYFAPYAVGWKDLPERQPPGQSPVTPPDRPPSEHFELYPRQPRPHRAEPRAQ